MAALQELATAFQSMDKHAHEANEHLHVSRGEGGGGGGRERKGRVFEPSPHFAHLFARK